jgi:hypothetical protein
MKGGRLRRLRRLFEESFLALAVSGLMLPGAVAVATVFLFLTAPNDEGPHWNSALNRTEPRVCLFGAVIGLVFCALLALLACRRFTRADSACPGPYNELRQGFDDVTKRFAAGCDDDEFRAEACAACREACRHITYLEPIFAQPSPVGLPWLLGTGYIDAWRRLHAIEESLLVVEPVPRVVHDALDDEMRLDGSTIPQSATLLKRLRAAVANLDKTAVGYLKEAPQLPESNAPPDKASARAALAQVRGAIDEFRDGRREGLVRGRNRLFATVIFAGLTGCVLLFVAILSGRTPKDSILAVSAFYLVGGVVGLVKLLQSAASAASVSQEDYGLGVVRLIQTPLFSGLAGVGGVVLVQLAQLQQDEHTFSLSGTFDLDTNPYGLIAAAFFGLTPALLLSGLQQRVEQYRTDLNKSEASESQAT